MAVPSTRRLGPSCALLLAVIAAGCGGGSEPSIPADIALAPATVTFTAVGQQQQLSASITDQRGDPVDPTRASWSSNNVSVATVNSTGLVTATGSGTTQITAAVGGLAAIATVTVSERFDIQVRYLTTPTPAQADAFADAESRWESIITGDLPNLQANAAAGSCGANSPALNEAVDDLLIFVTLEPIDGPGSVLGAAGPCFIRVPGSLTVVGRMRFDTDDLAAMESSGVLADVILHEMGHVLGFGTLWSEPSIDLLAGPALSTPPGTDPHFTGAGAIAAFNAAGGSTYTGGQKVPVEDTGGPGTADSHWRELVLDTELMTGFVASAGNALSAISVRSLADMGYVVNLAGADPFTFTPALRKTAPGNGVHLVNDIVSGPIYRLDRNGTIVGVVAR